MNQVGIQVACVGGGVGGGVARLPSQGAAVHAGAAAEDGQKHKHEYVPHLHT